MRTKIITTVLFFLALASCDNMVRFEAPQPEGQRNEKSIPKKLLGTYLNLEDSSRIIITREQIVRSVKADYKGRLSELDSADRIDIKNDTTLSEIDANMKVIIIVRGDSIFQHMDYADTLFSFRKDDVLRKFKGYYFLNNEINLNRWNVTKLGITKNGIILGTISKKAELDDLRELTNTKTDSVYNFKPTRRQLRKFVKGKGFSSEEKFVKI